MINLSQKARDNGTSRWWQPHYWFDPEVYFAENVADLKAHRLQLHWTLAARLLRSTHDTRVILYNVTVEKIPREKDLFAIHDETGSIIAIWSGKRDYFRSAYTPELATTEWDLSGNDFVALLTLRHVLDGTSSIFQIINLEKWQRRPKRLSHDSLAKRLRTLTERFTPEPTSAPVLAYRTPTN